MNAVTAYFRSLPRWYVIALGILFMAYLGLWGYTIHLAMAETAAGITPVMPVGPHDSTDYAELTQSLLQGQFHIPGWTQESFHTPGYPAFAAVLYGIFRSFFAVTLAQILLAFGMALMGRALVARLAGERIGNWASLLFLANPLVPSIALYVLTDILYSFLFILGMTLIVFGVPKRPWTYALLAAIIFGAAAYVRPVGFIALPVFIAPLFALRLPWKKAVLLAVAVCVVIALCWLPWMIRNKVERGVFGFSSLVELNFAYYAIPHYWNWRTGVPLDAAIQRVEMMSGVPMGTNAQGYPQNWYDIQNAPKLQKFIKAVILADPIRYVSWHLYNSTGFFLNPPINPAHPTANLKQLLVQGRFGDLFTNATSSGWYFAERLAILFSLLLVAIGAWRLRHEPLAWAFAFVILYVAALGGPASQARYRLPVDPLLCGFIVTGVVVLCARGRELLGMIGRAPRI